ncbi:heavy metal translocating P-type ATPase [Paracoccus marinaquae]|uniref:Heavy metal translocating P-type ATPase n=1 Tax=Paracoccus marinaquae TaxID=2841926 RepID=A0ABS6AD98_9RHOB|nr:heavy metal translocating P-type ATPase [Paracoccus marinaquae]MBU3028575.1 heavy metal translocating P-type ATPase [Paracoccus marinaquae]
MTSATELDLTIPGISCASCAARVERALAPLTGVSDISVNPVTKRAHLRLEGAALPQIDAALSEAGYPPELTTTRLEIEGMSCSSCVGRVERALSARPDVTEAVVNLVTHSASITHAPGVSPEALAETVSAIGYPARPVIADSAPAPHDHGDEARELRRQFLLALLLTLPLFLVEMGSHLVPGLHHWVSGLIGTRALWVAEMVLTAAVLAGPGRRFFTVGLPALLRGAPEMNSLVALGSGAAFLYSAAVTIMPGIVPEGSRFVYFEAAAVIVTLILMGRWLEARAKGQAGEAIRRLIELAPDHATVLRDGEPVEVPVAELARGDLIRLAPGERVAVDGVITEGRGHIDESMLTGEPVPAVKQPGDAVTGGTVNGQAALTYQVTATGGDTALSRIVAMVEAAQATKLPVQALVDRITRVFVPAVMALAALTFLLWLGFGPGLAEAVVAAVAVLIIACPCAMGLAVPVSIMVGTGRGAELGVLFRRGDALQRLAEAETVAFDKTGTLTLGHPQLVDLWVEGIAEDEALRLAAGAETRSEHPLAAAIVRAAQDRGLTPPEAADVTAAAGLGLTARVEDQDLLIGNRAALEGAGLTLKPTLAVRAERAAAEGATPVHLAAGGRHVASFALADPERPEAAGTIRALHDLGLSTTMLSGDMPATAQAVGGRLGIDEVQGGLRPEDKLVAIRAMGERTVFVGDGINDAPALAAAGTGIAIGSGTDIAIESADAVLMSGDPSGVVRAIRLSRAVMRNIRENLFWAFAYNTALIPVAMGVLVPFGGPQLSPMLGAGAMALSSVFVVGNALRLRRAAS